MEKRKVLICPLNWGLGHASRCVPIIRELHRQGHTIMLASSGSAHTFLRRELPEFTLEELPDYHIKYWRSIPIWLSVLFQFPKLYFKIRSEHSAVKKLITKHSIDTIISDNRLGGYDARIKSIYISHQIQIKDPFGSFQNIASRLHNRFMQKFDQIWIPDLEHPKENLGGALSHPSIKLEKSKYIGWLSRLEITNPSKESSNILILLSGIEPFRADLEADLIKQAKLLPSYTFTVIGGQITPTQEDHHLPSHMHYIPFGGKHVLEEEIGKASLIICRPGYSTLMDLALFKKKVLLIPSPGQTEQVYLANRLNCFITNQSKLMLSEQIPLAFNYPPLNPQGAVVDFRSIIKL